MIKMTERDPYRHENPYATPEASVDAGPGNEVYNPKILSFSGRIGRLRYLAYSTGIMLIVYLFLGIAMGTGASMGETGSMIGVGVGLIGVIFTLVISVAFGIRRLNDMNKSGWWIIINFIPYINLLMAIYLIFFPGTDGSNNYGPAPAPNTTGVKILGLLFPVLAIVGILAAILIPAYQGYQMKAEQEQSLMEEQMEQMSE